MLGQTSVEAAVPTKKAKAYWFSGKDGRDRSTFHTNGREFMIDLISWSPSLVPNMNWRGCERYTNRRSDPVPVNGTRAQHGGRKRASGNGRQRIRTFSLRHSIQTAPLRMRPVGTEPER